MVIYYKRPDGRLLEAQQVKAQTSTPVPTGNDVAERPTRRIGGTVQPKWRRLGGKH